MNNYAKLNLQIPGATTFPISKTLQSFLNLAWLFGERDLSATIWNNRMGFNMFQYPDYCLVEPECFFSKMLAYSPNGNVKEGNG
jgi:hypothetical protein